MHRFATILTVALGLGALALADETADPKDNMAGHQTTATAPDMKTDVTLQLALVDVYLTGAIANAKALDVFAQTPGSKNDGALIEEVRGNLDMSVNKALKHVTAMKAMKPTKENVAGGMPEAPMAMDFAKLDELEKQLKEVQTSASKINATKMTALSGSLDSLNSNLMAADQTFRDIAQAASFTRLDTVKLNAVPVKGTEEPMKPEIRKPGEMKNEKGDELQKPGNENLPQMSPPPGAPLNQPVNPPGQNQMNPNQQP
jgi:hypothetical protein